MIRRWRTILDPETVDRLNPPTAREALAMWFLGSAWLLYGVWLAVLGLPVWLPAVPVVGLLSLWFWKRRGAIFTFPLMLVTAMVLDARLEGVASAHLTDLVMAATAVVMIARFLARGDVRQPSSPGERVLQVAVAASLVIGIVDPNGQWPRVARLLLPAIAAGLSAWLGARRAAAHARLQLVFPWAAAMLGTAVIAAVVMGRSAPSQAFASSVASLLAATLPFAWSGSMRRGRTRIPHLFVALLGSVALVLPFVVAYADAVTVRPLADPRLGVLSLVVIAFASVPRLRHVRLASAVVFALLAVVAGEPRLVPVAIVLAALAAGLVLGEPEMRAPRRRGRRSQNPVLEEASCVRRSA
ncbi:MAG: hypothetical protein RL760_1134 [Candidatus Eisenbacteria bacterium]